MTGATLLVELLTEELPPKALPKIGQAFADGIAAGGGGQARLSVTPPGQPCQLET